LTEPVQTDYIELLDAQIKLVEANRTLQEEVLKYKWKLILTKDLLTQAETQCLELNEIVKKFKDKVVELKPIDEEYNMGIVWEFEEILGKLYGGDKNE
jgi:hypothetical protein